MLKKTGLVVAIATAAGGPYLFSSKSGQTAAHSSTEVGGHSIDMTGHSAYGGAHADPAASHAYQPTTVQTAELAQLAEVLRYDHSMTWVLARWPRVSTGLADLDLQGYRVSLITGTSEADLAGSLTYYFNKQQQIQRITLQGTTGDPRQLITLLVQQHGFAYEQGENPSEFLYRVRDGKKVVSELKIKPAPVVRKDSGYSRYSVSLSMEHRDK